MTESRKLRVFLCHASQDKPIVRELYQRLLSEGWIDPWLDEEKLLPGQDWDLEIEKAVEVADAVVVCLSSNSVDKEGYIQKELRYVINIAFEKPEDVIYLIPLRLDNCQVPRRLKGYHYLDYFSNRDSVYPRLLSSLMERSRTLKAPNNSIWVEPDVEKKNIKYEKRNFPSFDNLMLMGKTKGGDNLYNLYGIEFVKVPNGKFLMGSSDQDEMANDIEKPQHSLSIPYDYLISRFPVTNHQFSEFLNEESQEYKWMPDWKEKQNHPAVHIEWEIALRYCEWLGKKIIHTLPLGYILRLPTEAEWEKGARGSDGRIFPWGNSFDFMRCNVYGKVLMSIETVKLLFTNPKGLLEESYNTTPVDMFTPKCDSPFGVSDMSGNVYEWTTSILKSYPYDIKDGRENEDNNVLEGERRVKRGGSCNRPVSQVRTAYREGAFSSSLVGIRLVVAPPIKNIIAKSILESE